MALHRTAIPLRFIAASELNVIFLKGRKAMARIGILTCSNCTQDTNCAAVVCLGDMRKRKGFFERYKDEKI